MITVSTLTSSGVRLSALALAWSLRVSAKQVGSEAEAGIGGQVGRWAGGQEGRRAEAAWTPLGLTNAMRARNVFV